MPDIRLITILPPQQIQGVSLPQAVSGNQSGNITIGTFPVGSVLSGFIINRDANGNPVLRTEKGDITFASNFFLKIGSEVTIRIEHSAGSNTAHILSVNGQDPEVAVLQSSFEQEPDVILNTKNSPANNQQQQTITAYKQEPAAIISTSSLAKPVTITGTVISLAPNTDKNQLIPTLTQAPSNIQTGSQLTLKIASISASTQSISHLNIPNADHTTESTPLTQSPTLPQTPYNPYARFAPTPPAQLPTLPLTPTLIQNQITASVVSNSQDGETILSTPIGIVKIKLETTLPVGSNIVFEIVEIKVPDSVEEQTAAIAQAPVSATPAPLTKLARNASALSNIFTLLLWANTEEAANFTNNTIPTIGSGIIASNNPAEKPHNIISSLINYTVAIKNGDFREWLGRGNVRWLVNNGHDNLLQKAEAEFFSISNQFTQQPAHSWQSLFFPVAVDGELQQTRLFVKRDRRNKQENGQSRPEEDTRFVLEMDLSQLGEMQMDGFVRRDNQHIQFDLIIRSHHQLSPEIQKDILHIYNDVGEMTGYKGSVSFQSVKDFPVNPMEEIIAGSSDGIVA